MLERTMSYTCCLVLIRRFPSPPRSIHFGDVIEAHISHGLHDTKRLGRAGKMSPWDKANMLVHVCLIK